MKNILLSSFTFFCFQVYAQDTIFFKSGTPVISKIEEVNPETIKYRKFDLVDGPLIIVNRNDIVKIKYSNGTIEEISLSPPLKKEVLNTDSALINKTNIFYLDLVSIGVKKLNIGYEKIIANGHLSFGINGYYAFEEQAFVYQHLFYNNTLVYESHGVGATLKWYPKNIINRKGYYVVLNSDYNTNHYKAYNLDSYKLAYDQYLYNEKNGINKDKPLLETFYSYKKGSTYKTVLGLGWYTSPINNLYLSVDGSIGFAKNYLPAFVYPQYSGNYLTKHATQTIVYFRASLKIGYRFGCNKNK